jgi:hypothetical protein
MYLTLEQLISIGLQPIHYIQQLVRTRTQPVIKTTPVTSSPKPDPSPESIEAEDERVNAKERIKAKSFRPSDLSKDVGRVVMSRLSELIAFEPLSGLFAILAIWRQFGGRVCLAAIVAVHVLASLLRFANELRFEWIAENGGPRVDADLWMQMHQQFPWSSLLARRTSPKQQRQTLNKVLSQLWPLIRQNVRESCRGTRFGFGLQCSTVDLGRVAPTIQRLRAHNSKWTEGRWTSNAIGDQLCLQAECDWPATDHQRFTLKWILGQLQVQRISCCFTLNVIVRFRSRNVGGEWTSTRISFEQTPQVFEYKTEGLWLAVIDFFALFRPLVQLFASIYLVEPNHLLLQNSKLAEQDKLNRCPETIKATGTTEDPLPNGLLQVRTICEPSKNDDL